VLDSRPRLRSLSIIHNALSLRGRCMNPSLFREALYQMGIGFVSNTMHHALCYSLRSGLNRAETEIIVSHELRAHGIKLSAADVVNGLAERGLLSVTANTIAAPQGTTFGSMVGEAPVEYDNLVVHAS
jgi:hypothetical protein